MGRGLVAAVAAGILGWSGIASAGNQKDRPTHPAAQAALRYFESVRNRGFETFLRELRRQDIVRAREATRLLKRSLERANVNVARMGEAHVELSVGS